MNIQIRYYSKSGNTKKVADAIAQELGITAETTEKNLDGETDILFIGSAVYGGKIDEKMRSFLESLDGSVKKTAVFSTAMADNTPYTEIKQILDAKGIPLDETTFHCRGKFLFFNRKRPSEEDLNNARAFAGKIVG